MFSDKTRRYFIADSKEALLTRFKERNQFIEKLPFGEVLFIIDEDTIYAIKNKCPHQGAAMEGCFIKDGRVVCPLHKYGFDLNHGRGHGLYLET